MNKYVLLKVSEVNFLKVCVKVAPGTVEFGLL
jgi:hypothetical protein